MYIYICIQFYMHVYTCVCDCIYTYSLCLGISNVFEKQKHAKSAWDFNCGLYCLCIGASRHLADDDVATLDL